MEKVSFFINRILNVISGTFVLFLTFMTVLDVLGRFLFNRPIPGTIEATEMGLVIIAYLTFGYTEHFKEHVVIDTAYEVMPVKVKRIVYLFSNVLTVVVALFLSWQLFMFSGRMKAGNYHTAVLNIKYAHIVLIAAVGAFCYALAVASNMIRFQKDEGRKNP